MSEKDDDAIIETDLDTDPAEDDTEGSDKLGDAGKKALDSMKGKWQKERDARKALEDRLAKLEHPGDDKTGEQPDPAEVRKQARAEARAEVLRDRALDKVETRAAKLFADPEDARALLASQVDDFLDDGDIDTNQIDEALTRLLKKKPHLAAATAGKRFNGSADGGARNGSGKPTQLTDQDLKRMTPQQIVEARSKGQFDDLMGG